MDVEAMRKELGAKWHEGDACHGVIVGQGSNRSSSRTSSGVVW